MLHTLPPSLYKILDRPINSTKSICVFSQFYPSNLVLSGNADAGIKQHSQWLEYWNTGVWGYHDPRLINPWAAIESDLIQQLDADPVILQQVRQLSAQRLGPVNMQMVQNAEQYFAVLKNNLDSEEDVVDFLANLMDYMEYHTDMGTTRYKNQKLGD